MSNSREESQHGKPSMRDNSPKSVINPLTFPSQPSSTSGSMEHRHVGVGLPLPPPFETDNMLKRAMEGPMRVDPLCRINLKETSEFVRAFPMARETRGSVPRRLDSQGSPPPRVSDISPFVPMRSSNASSCANNPNLMRKPFPSKWDDAEKWIVNSATDSPLVNTTLLGGFKSLPKPPTQPHSFQEHGKEKQHESIQPPTMEQIRAPNRDFGFSCGDFSIGSMSSVVSSSVISDDYNVSSSLCSFPSQDGATPFTSFPFIKDKFEDKVEAVSKKKTQGLMKDCGIEVVPNVQHRDMGTETTPLASSCHTPIKNGSSPARHNTPASRSGLLNRSTPGACIDIEELEKRHYADLQLVDGLPSGIQFNSLDKSVSVWSSREEEEEEVSKSLRHFDISECKRNILDARACAWEEAERSKCLTRYQREEARIEAWINLQSAKAESETRKLEVKIEKMRSILEEKLMKKMAAAHRRAEEWRSTAKTQQNEQLAKTAERAERMREDGHFSFSFTRCSCFSCRSC